MSEAAMGGTAENRRTARILEAASRLYMAYGARRTSMDDIATEAGMAKGSLYLSFRSKDELFHALIRNLLDQWLVSARDGAAARASTLDKLVVYLDATVGEPARLLRATAHAADLIEAKGRVAGELLAGYRHAIARDLSSLLADHPSMPVLVMEAAFGCRETGDMDSGAYKERLSRHIAALLHPSSG